MHSDRVVGSQPTHYSFVPHSLFSRSVLCEKKSIAECNIRMTIADEADGRYRNNWRAGRLFGSRDHLITALAKIEY